MRLQLLLGRQLNGCDFFQVGGLAQNLMPRWQVVELAQVVESVG